MAMAASSLDQIFKCQICLEDYRNTGDRVPRILPCSHTFCEKCLLQWIQENDDDDENEVDCPECRNTHKVQNGVRTFPQNKFFLFCIKKDLETEEEEEEEKCEDHGKELIFFCKQPECQKAICKRCLTKCHRGHVVVEIEEEEKEVLVREIDSATQDLEAANAELLVTENEKTEEFEAKIKTCENILQTTRRFSWTVSYLETKLLLMNILLFSKA